MMKKALLGMAFALVSMAGYAQGVLGARIHRCVL